MYRERQCIHLKHAPAAKQFAQVYDANSDYLKTTEAPGILE